MTTEDRIGFARALRNVVIAFAISAVVGSLISDCASAAPQQKIESKLEAKDVRYIVKSTVMAAVMSNCPGYKIVFGGLRAYAEKHNVRWGTLFPKVLAALQFYNEERFDSFALDEEVVGLVEFTFDLAVASGRANLCGKVADGLVNDGILSGVSH